MTSWSCEAKILHDVTITITSRSLLNMIIHDRDVIVVPSCSSMTLRSFASVLSLRECSVDFREASWAFFWGISAGKKWEGCWHQPHTLTPQLTPPIARATAWCHPAITHHIPHSRTYAPASTSRPSAISCHQPSSSHQLASDGTKQPWDFRPSCRYNHVLSVKSEHNSLSGTTMATEPTSFKVSTLLVFKIWHHAASTHLRFQFNWLFDWGFECVRQCNNCLLSLPRLPWYLE
jgi:hypothetical protein